MSLDTFEKRLASQGLPLPGGISTRDRWSIGGVFEPSTWADGGIVALLAAATAALSGTFTGPVPSSLNFADRMRLEGLPMPGDGLQIENRFTIGGSFTHLAGGTDVAGKINTSLGAIATSLRGRVTDGNVPLALEDRYHVEGVPMPGAGITVRDRYAIAGTFTRIAGAPPPFTGGISSSTGAMRASIVGSHTAAIFFDVDYSVTPAFTFAVMPARDGDAPIALAPLVAALRGTTLPPDSVSGSVRPLLGLLTSSLRGTFTPAPARDGIVHGDFSAVVAHLRGSVVPPQGVIGRIAAALDPITPNLSGTFTKWSTDGHIDARLGAVSFEGFGQPLLPGDIYGFVGAKTAPIDVAMLGTSVILVGDLTADAIVIEPEFSASIDIEPEFSDGSVQMEPIK